MTGSGQPRVEEQRDAFEEMFTDRQRWAFHDTPDPLTRYVRDRRLKMGLRMLARRRVPAFSDLTALVVCGGVGGEGTILADAGFGEVTNSDIAPSALDICRERDSRLIPAELNAEAMELPDGAYDVVVVQDGLHHLTRPVAGFNEMLRVARVAAIVIEPYESLVGKAFGQTWEKEGEATTYVFRWDKRLVAAATRSQLGNVGASERVKRLWDHSSRVERMALKLASLGGRSPSRQQGYQMARAIYAGLRPFDWCGNNMIAVVCKPREGTRA